MQELLFVLSAVVVIGYSVRVVSCTCGNSMKVPLPLLHIIGVSPSNTYVYTPAIAYQVYFWSGYAGLFGA